jgi:hypothetical protein
MFHDPCNDIVLEAFFEIGLILQFMKTMLYETDISKIRNYEAGTQRKL